MRQYTLDNVIPLLCATAGAAASYAICIQYPAAERAMYHIYDVLPFFTDAAHARHAQGQFDYVGVLAPGFLLGLAGGIAARSRSAMNWPPLPQKTSQTADNTEQPTD